MHSRNARIGSSGFGPLSGCDGCASAGGSAGASFGTDDGGVLGAVSLVLSSSAGGVVVVGGALVVADESPSGLVVAVVPGLSTPAWRGSAITAAGMASVAPPRAAAANSARGERDRPKDMDGCSLSPRSTDGAATMNAAAVVNL
jgi:hypothetical protein